jgi:hypothetical protein
MNEFVILVLVALLVSTQVTWMIICNGLINKVMSRDFPEYRKAVMHKAAEPFKVQLPDESQPEDSQPPIFS